MSIDINPQTSEVVEHAPLPLVVPEQPLQDNSAETRSQWQRTLQAARRAGKMAVAGGVAATAVAFPVAAAITAVEVAPPATVKVAGQDVSVDLDVQKNYTTVDGMLNRSDHAAVPGIQVGANVNANLLTYVSPHSDQEKVAIQQLFQDPKPEMDRITKAAHKQAIVWGGSGFAVAILIEAGIGGTYLYQRRKFKCGSTDYQENVHAHNRGRNRIEAIGAAGLILGVVAMGGVIVTTPNHHEVRPAAVFNGTPLAGTEEVSGAFDRVGPRLAELYNPNQAALFNKIAANLESLAANRPDLTERKPGTIRFMFGDDVQFVQGAARAWGLSAKLFNADAMMYGGDWTDTDSEYESFIIDTTSYYSGNMDVLSMDGLHDGNAISEAEAARSNFTRADNTTIDFNGVDILALNDPRVSTVDGLDLIEMFKGVHYKQRDPNVSIEDFIANAVTEICNTHPQIVAMHDNKLAKQIISDAHVEGCDVPLVLDGRSYKPLGLQRYLSATGSQTLEYTNGSTGGHRNTSFSPGMLQGPAYEAIVDLDPKENTITITPITITTKGAIYVGTPIINQWVLEQSSANSTTRRSNITVLSKTH